MDAAAIPRRDAALRALGISLVVPIYGALIYLVVLLVLVIINGFTETLPSISKWDPAAPVLSVAIALTYGSLLAPLIVGHLLIDKRRVMACPCGFVADRG